MKAIIHEGIEVDRCSDCGGLFFDALEERDIATRKGAEAVDDGHGGRGASNNRNGKIDCPRCKTRMIRMVSLKQPHIWYESCSVCFGNYFDAGEFRDMNRADVSDILFRAKRGERPLD
jgi:uncharacterized protein